MDMVSGIRTQLKTALGDRKIRQVLSLYLSMVLGIAVGIGVSVVNTRFLGPQRYGDLKFLQNMFTFVVSFLTFGTFVTGSRLLAQREHESRKHELMGNILILASASSLAMIVGLFTFSFFEERLFHNELGRMIRIFSPLLFVFPFNQCLENILQGDNRIYEMSVLRISPRLCYLAGALAFNYFVPLSLHSALGIQLLTHAALILVMIRRLKPSLGKVRRNLSIIWVENRSYGFQVYLGMIFGVATGQLAGLSIGYFTGDNTNVGFYALALTISMPLMMIPSVVGTTFFKDFANRSSIPPKATKVTIVLSLLALATFVLVIKKLVLFLYSSEYIAVVPLAYIVSFGSLCHGFGNYVNRFLGAHGKGRELRNGAILVGVANIAGNTVLVSRYGAQGAAITKLLSGLIFVFAMLYYYKKYTGELRMRHK